MHEKLPSYGKLSADRDPPGHQRTRSFKSRERRLIPSAKVRETALSERMSVSVLVVANDEHHILQKVGKTDQLVIHDHRGVSPDRKLEVDKSTAIVHNKGIGETSLSSAPKTDLGAERPSLSRR
ncbi:KfrB domain-containing protein [Pseudomonas sp. S60]|uniref:KfrB domain-containing protein n=1 Tax=Pseudomonas sp. S60 TaxID=211124 RepID=UPI003FA7C8C1